MPRRSPTPKKAQRTGKPAKKGRPLPASGYSGVTRVAPNRYHARVALHANGKSRTVHCGSWLTDKEAAIAYDRALLHLGCADRGLNFPKRSRKLGAVAPAELVRRARTTKKHLRTSRYYGITRQPDGVWSARVMVDGRSIYLGQFATETEAAVARDRAMLYYRGRAEPLNFPERKSKPASAEQLRRSSLRRRTRRAPPNLMGVTPVTTSRWKAEVQIRGASHLAGYWDTAEEAALARDRALLFYGKASNPKLNFPKQARKLGPASAETLCREGRQELKRRMTSRFRGVHRSRNGMWAARIDVQKRSRNLGQFENELDAALAYDRAALAISPKNARVNFDPVSGRELLGARAERSFDGDPREPPKRRKQRKQRKRRAAPKRGARSRSSRAR